MMALMFSSLNDNKVQICFSLFLFYFIVMKIQFFFAAVAFSPDKPITTDSLVSLVHLTEFVTLMPRFTASVPSSWCEVQQDQQRLHHHTLLDPGLHTRTWKLRTDNSR